MPLTPYLLIPVLWFLTTLLGVAQVKKLIQVHEGKRELKHGSAGLIRTMSGWVMIVLWGLATWFLATILGDWGTTGDLQGAIARSMNRLRILLEILAALSDD